MILIQSVIYPMKNYDYYLEQSVNIKMIKKQILILELSKHFGSSRHSLIMMKKYMKRVVANRFNAKKNSKNKEQGLEPYQFNPNGFQ